MVIVNYPFFRALLNALIIPGQSTPTLKSCDCLSLEDEGHGQHSVPKSSINVAVSLNSSVLKGVANKEETATAV